MSTSGSGEYALLDQLAEEFAARYRRGERPSLAEYVEKYPHLADEANLRPRLGDEVRAGDRDLLWQENQDMDIPSPFRNRLIVVESLCGAWQCSQRHPVERWAPG
jgi:hypothetical protein